MTTPANILLLGGTAEANRVAVLLAQAGLRAIYSYAGRTAAPPVHPIAQRTGGFGGVEGLAAYLKDNEISHVIDATHPFAAQMSGNAVQACARLKLPLVALERRPWLAGPGDDWQGFPDLAAMAAALPQDPTRIFLAIGRQHLEAFAEAPQHDYLLRLVDAPAGALPLPRVQVVVSKGPFTLQGDLDLMRGHGTRLVVAKNAGGTAARAKLDAARLLGLPVWLAERPQIPPREAVESPEEVMAWLAHHPARLGV